MITNLKEYFRKMFSFSEKEFTELDDDDINDYSKEFRNIEFGEYLLKNGFSVIELFNQVKIYYNHILDIVLTSEYSDNTGNEYWRYFDSAEEYNNHVCIDNEGMR